MATAITAGALAGEYMESFVVVEWRVKQGDTVTEGDIILTIETAKAAVDVEAPHNGVVTATFAESGTEVPAATILCLIGTDASDVAYETTEVAKSARDEIAAASESSAVAVAPSSFQAPPQVQLSSRIIASPAARRTAQDAGIDLRGVQPTSPFGRIKKRDVARAEAFIVSTPTRGIQAPPLDQPGILKIHKSGNGSGVPIFMIHGFASDAKSWYPLDRHLGKDRPVYSIDLPNHGSSPKRRVNFVNLVREVRSAFDLLDLEQAHVIGHSLGGALALALTDTRPRNVASLTLIAPGGLSPKINGDFVSGIARASRPDSLRPWLKVMVNDPRIIDDAFVAAAFSARNDDVLRAAQVNMGDLIFPDGTQSFDLAAALDRVEVPTRIIWGKKDRVIDWTACLQAPGRIGLHLLAGVGHVPQLEAPDLTLSIVQSLIRSV